MTAALAGAPDLASIGAALLAQRSDRAASVWVLQAGSDDAERLAAGIEGGCSFAHQPDPPLWQHGRIPVTLGSDDLDVTEQRPRLWPGGTLPARYRRRRVDTLYAGRPIGLLVLGDPSTAAAVLRGAGGVLAASRPAVLVDLRSVSVPHIQPLRDAVLAELPGYRWTDEDGPIATALPQGAVPPSVAGRAVLDAVCVPFDEWLVCGGLHPPEPRAPQGGRWTGASYATWFMLPRPPPGPWLLRLEIADWGNAGAGFAAVIDGVTLDPSAIAPDAIEYSPCRLDRQTGTALRVDLWPPHGARDLLRPRRIGLRILRATLRRID